MPFGLSDAGRTFQHVAKTICSDLIEQNAVVVYLEDILVHTHSWPQHLEIMSGVLQRIQRYNLQLQPNKCKWGSTQLKFLGFLISADGIQMDPSKVIAITNYPPPSTKSLQSFLGMTNFALRFIPNLAAITSPLRELLKKGFPFRWTDQCESSFNELKATLQEATLVAHPRLLQNIQTPNRCIEPQTWCIIITTKHQRTMETHCIHKSILDLS